MNPYGVILPTLALIGAMGIAAPLAQQGDEPGRRASAQQFLERLLQEEDVDVARVEDLEVLVDDPLDVNTTSASQLARIPGVEAFIADAIIRSRKRQGPYHDWKSVEDAVPAGTVIPETLRMFAVVRPITTRSAPRRVRPRQRGYWSTQLLVQREVVGPDRAHALAERTATSRTLSRLRVDDLSGLSIRLSLGRGDAFRSSRIGALRLSTPGERVEIVAGAHEVTAGSGVVFASSAISDFGQYAEGHSVFRASRVSPRHSLTSGEQLSGVGFSLLPHRRARLVGTISRSGEPGPTRNTVGLIGEWTAATWSIALSGVVISSDASFLAGGRLHEMHRFSGSKLRLGSARVGATLPEHWAGGEVGLASNGSTAVVAAIGTRGGGSARYLLMLRSISSRFPLPHGKPSGLASPEGSGEDGLTVAARIRRGRVWIRMAADAYLQQWARSTSAWPTGGQRYRLELERRDRGWSAAMRLTQQWSPGQSSTNDEGESVMRTPVPLPRSTIRIQLDLRQIPRIEMRLHVEAVRASDVRRSVRTGTVVYQQIRWRPMTALLIEARNASFLARSFIARSFAHENDVFLQPVLATVYGDGHRQYLRARIDASRRWIAEAKVGRLERSHDDESSADPPTRTRRVEVRVQLTRRL